MCNAIERGYVFIAGPITAICRIAGAPSAIPEISDVGDTSIALAKEVELGVVAFRTLIIVVIRNHLVTAAVSKRCDQCIIVRTDLHISTAAHRKGDIFLCRVVHGVFDLQSLSIVEESKVNGYIQSKFRIATTGGGHRIHLLHGISDLQIGFVTSVSISSAPPITVEITDDIKGFRFDGICHNAVTVGGVVIITKLNVIIQNQRHFYAQFTFPLGQTTVPKIIGVIIVGGGGRRERADKGNGISQLSRSKFLSFFYRPIACRKAAKRCAIFTGHRD